MNICPYCQRTVPGVEKVCKECYEKRYSETQSPKPPRTFIGLLTAYWKTPISPVEPTESVRVPPIAWGLAVGASVSLYALFSLSDVVGGVFLIAANGIIAWEIWDCSVRRSRQSIFSGVVLFLSAVSFALERVTGNFVFLRGFAALACVYAAYIVYDRKRVI